MSQADALLNSIAVTSVSTTSGEYIVVGEDRFITIPDDQKKLGVQYDHDVEVKTFRCPRFWDETDLSSHKIYINYMRPDESLATYWCQNVRVESDVIYFDWIISGHATEFEGNVSFLICAKVTGTDGLEVTHWNSELCSDFYVSKGMKCPETIIRRHPDIITQLLIRMETAETNLQTWMDETDREISEWEDAYEVDYAKRMSTMEQNTSPSAKIPSGFSIPKNQCSQAA